MTDRMDVKTKLERSCENWAMRLSRRTVHCPRE